MSRIYGQKESIDSKKVNAFFEKRFSRENPLASVMLRGDENDGIAEKRDQNENWLLTSLLHINGKVSVLDIGCGLGRWATNMANRLEFYDGIDFARSYVDAANESFQDNDTVNFYQMSATDIDKGKLHSACYDLLIINGLNVYLNDEDVDTLVKTLPTFCHAGSKIYFRESVSLMPHRLTLKDFPSDELNSEYNAIYRTTQEYEEYFLKYLTDFKCTKSDLLLTKELGSREETNQRFWFFERG